MVGGREGPHKPPSGVGGHCFRWSKSAWGDVTIDPGSIRSLSQGVKIYRLQVIFIDNNILQTYLFSDPKCKPIPEHILMKLNEGVGFKIRTKQLFGYYLESRWKWKCQWQISCRISSHRYLLSKCFFPTEGQFRSDVNVYKCFTFYFQLASDSKIVLNDSVGPQTVRC